MALTVRTAKAFPLAVPSGKFSQSQALVILKPHGKRHPVVAALHTAKF
jgi:hypothetical protein